MGKRRMIDSKIRDSQTFASFTFRQRDLWHGIIAIADDQGRMPGIVAYLRSKVWPYDDIKLTDIEYDLQVLAKAGNILRYEIDGKHYIQILKWWCYQNMQWAGKSDHPNPPEWTDRERYHGKGNEIFTENWDKQGGFIVSKGNELPSEVPSEEGTPREEDEVKDKDNEEDNEEEEYTPTPYSQLSAAFVNATQIPELTGGAKNWNEAINEMVKIGIEPDDIEEAVTILDEKDYTIIGPRSVCKTALDCMRKRKGKNKKDPLRKSEKARQKYAEWENY